MGVVLVSGDDRARRGRRVACASCRARSPLALAGSLASASLALAAVELLEADPAGSGCSSCPRCLWGLAFRAYGSERRRHEHVEFLYRTMRTMQGAPEFRTAVRELLVAARTMLSAEFAEIVLFDVDIRRKAR